MPRSASNQTTIRDAAQIFLDEANTALEAVSYDTLLYNEYYYPVGSTSIDVILRAKKPVPHDVTIFGYTRSGSSNYQIGSASDGDWFNWVIRAGETVSNTVTMSLASTPSTEGNYFYVRSIRPSPSNTLGETTWVNYGEFLFYLYFEDRTTAVPPHYVKIWDLDPAATGILPRSGGKVSGGTDVIDYEYPSLIAADPLYFNITNNGMNQAYYTHKLMMAGAGDYAWFAENLATVPINPFPITGGIRGFRLEYSATPLTAGPRGGIATTANFSQAWAYTDAMFQSRYGYYEIKAQYPTRKKGAWPICFWSTGSLYWPMEIDIAEVQGSDATLGSYDINAQMAFNFHAGTRESPQSDNPNDALIILSGIPDLSGFQMDAWHVYGLLWTRQYLYFYVDGVRVHAIQIEDDRLNGLHRWLIQMQSQNNYTSTADYPISAGSSPSAYQEMQVEYVRVFQDVNRDTTTETALDKSLAFVNNTPVTTERSGYKWDSTVAPPGLLFASSDTVVSVDADNVRGYYDPLENDANWQYMKFCARSYGSVKTGKKYAKIQVTGSSHKGLFLCTAADPMIFDQGNPAITTFGYYHKYTSLWFAYDTNVPYHFDNTNSATLTGSPIAAWDAEDIVELCVDGPNHKFWFKVNGGNWMGTTTNADPTDQTTGFTLPTQLQDKALLIGVYFNDVDLATSDDGAVFLAGSAPSGYSNF